MATIELTEEQCLAIQAEKNGPVRVIDPGSNRAYVLLALEQYKQLPNMPDHQDEPTGLAASTATNVAAASHSPLQTLPVRIRELATPPEVAEAAQRWCKKLGMRRKSNCQDVEDGLKIQYYFGGQYVGVLYTDKGPIVVVAGSLDSEAFGRQWDTLPLEVRRKVHLQAERPWKGDIAMLPTAFSYED